MKLSKESAKRQNAIRKALAAGKPLSGVLAGLLVAAAGCRPPRTPANTMGSYPNPNAVNESPECGLLGDLKETPRTDSTNAPCTSTTGKPLQPKRRRPIIPGQYLIEEPEPEQAKPAQKPAETKSGK